MNTSADRLLIVQPEWLEARLERAAPLQGDEARMRFVIALARENVEHGTGGPFAAAVFDGETGELLGAGVNSVVRLENSALHAEMMALMFAESRLGSYTLRRPGRTCELVTSCAPCAMCLGAALWSGVRRIVCSADREDAERIGFDEGPVFPESYRYLEDRGVRVVRGVLREEAAAVMDLYLAEGAPVYNG